MSANWRWNHLQFCSVQDGARTISAARGRSRRQVGHHGKTRPLFSFQFSSAVLFVVSTVIRFSKVDQFQTTEVKVRPHRGVANAKWRQQAFDLSMSICSRHFLIHSKIDLNSQPEIKMAARWSCVAELVLPLLQCNGRTLVCYYSFVDDPRLSLTVCKQPMIFRCSTK